MRTKSKYRRQAFKDGGAVHDVPVEPPVEAASETPVPEVPPLPEDEHRSQNHRIGRMMQRWR